MFPDVLPEPTARLLEKISQESEIKEFYLVGGTSLALQIGHRLSVDLDFFFDGYKLPIALIRHQFMQGRTMEILYQDPETLHAIVDEVKLSFLCYHYPLVEPKVEFHLVPLAGVLDIMLMKLTAIASRGSKRDFIDLYFGLKEKQMHLSELLKQFKTKYAEHEYNEVHFLKSLAFFQEADKEPMPKMLVPADWDEVKQFFLQELGGWHL